MINTKSIDTVTVQVDRTEAITFRDSYREWEAHFRRLAEGCCGYDDCGFTKQANRIRKMHVAFDAGIQADSEIAQ